MNLDTLRADFRGQIHTPSDATYDAARAVWNTSIDKRPSIIASCSGTADVVAAVRFARENGLLTAIRGGGHSVAGRALCDEGIVIDLSKMRAVSVDPATGRVTVQGGARLSDVDRETHAFGLAVPCGVVPDTGIAGLTLGGGVGFLIRKYGMTIDNLLSCQVVTADGRILTASANENEDLFWALRGGGGNFGVVTSFTYQGRPVRNVIGGMLIYPRPAAFDVLRNFRDFIESAPEELTAYAALLHGPDGSPVVGVVPVWCGDIEEGLRVLEPLRKFGNPVMDLVQPMPHPVMQGLLGQSFPGGLRNTWKSSMHESLSDAAIQTVIDHAAQMPSPLGAVVLEYYGGAYSRVPSDATAFPSRHLPWDIIVIAQWQDPAGDEASRNWAREIERALRPMASPGQLLSILDNEPDDVVASAFGPNIGRPRAVKKRYDPDNFFRVNTNIKPA